MNYTALRDLPLSEVAKWLSENKVRLTMKWSKRKGYTVKARTEKIKLTHRAATLQEALDLVVDRVINAVNEEK